MNMYYNNDLCAYSSDPLNEYDTLDGWDIVPYEWYERWVMKLQRLADLFAEEDVNEFSV